MRMIIAIIPAYNEEKTVADIVKKTKKHVNKVIVVDDFSSDDTVKRAKKAGALVLKHKENSGLGASLKTGFKKALKMKADVVITLDADGQHNPEDIPNLINEIENNYDFVLGRRRLSEYPIFKRIGNFLLTMTTNFISGTDLRDTESGFRAIKGSALKKFYLKSEKYEVAVEIIFEVGRNNLKATNVQVISPRYVRGVNILDGFRNFMFLLHRRERTWRSYLQDIKYVLKKWL